MFAVKSKLVMSVIMLAGLALSATANAFPAVRGGAPMHGGGNGGFHHGHSWQGWSWGIPWDYYGYGYGGNDVAWQQGYNAALMQAQWAAQQQLQAERAQLQMAQPDVTKKTVKTLPQPKPIRKAAPATPPVPPIVLTPEERAAGKFRLAMLLADDGKTADAAEYCTDIVTKYQGTPTAVKAQAFLDQVTKGNRPKQIADVK